MLIICSKSCHRGYFFPEGKPLRPFGPAIGGIFFPKGNPSAGPEGAVRIRQAGIPARPVGLLRDSRARRAAT